MKNSNICAIWTDFYSKNHEIQKKKKLSKRTKKNWIKNDATVNFELNHRFTTMWNLAWRSRMFAIVISIGSIDIESNRSVAFRTTWRLLLLILIICSIYKPEEKINLAN